VHKPSHEYSFIRRTRLAAEHECGEATIWARLQ
jgi:hypothetical protein